MAPRVFFALEMALTFGAPVLLGLYELRSLGRRRPPQGPFPDGPKPPRSTPPQGLPEGSRRLPACLIPVRLDPADPMLAQPQEEHELVH